jgi:hypothetical protein
MMGFEHADIGWFTPTLAPGAFYMEATRIVVSAKNPDCCLSARWLGVLPESGLIYRQQIRKENFVTLCGN